MFNVTMLKLEIHIVLFSFPGEGRASMPLGLLALVEAKELPSSLKTPNNYTFDMMRK